MRIEEIVGFSCDNCIHTRTFFVKSITHPFVSVCALSDDKFEQCASGEHCYYKEVINLKEAENETY